MRNESNISFGGAIILLTLFAQTLMFGGKIHFESILQHSQSLQKAIKYKKVSIFTFPGIDGL